MDYVPSRRLRMNLFVTITRQEYFPEINRREMWDYKQETVIKKWNETNSKSVYDNDIPVTIVKRSVIIYRSSESSELHPEPK